MGAAFCRCVNAAVGLFGGVGCQRPGTSGSEYGGKRRDDPAVGLAPLQNLLRHVGADGGAAAGEPRRLLAELPGERRVVSCGRGREQRHEHVVRRLGRCGLGEPPA